MKRTKMLAPTLLALVLLLALPLLLAGRAQALDTWNGTAADAFAGGSGAVTDPYRIATGAQLAYLAQQVENGNSYNAKYFILTAGVSDWAAEAMAWAVGAGVINGTVDMDGNVILDAQGTATRAQIAAIMRRFCSGAHR